MTKSDLIHIRVGKEMKRQMQHLIDMGLFSTEAEIAREGIRNILIKYIREMNLESKPEDKKENGKKSK